MKSSTPYSSSSFFPSPGLVGCVALGVLLGSLSLLTAPALVAQTLSAQPATPWMTVHYQRTWAADYDVLVTVVELECPAGHEPRDVNGHWIPELDRISPDSRDRLLRRFLDVSPRVETEGFSQPAITETTARKLDPKLPQPENAEHLLAIQCTVMRARTASLGTGTDGGLTSKLDLRPLTRSGPVRTRDLFLLEGRCSPTGTAEPKQVLQTWTDPSVIEGTESATTLRLECVQGTLKDIHQPSSTNEPPPPDGRQPPWSPNPDRILVSRDDTLALGRLSEPSASSSSPNDEVQQLSAPVEEAAAADVPGWRLALPFGRGSLQVPATLPATDPLIALLTPSGATVDRPTVAVVAISSP